MRSNHLNRKIKTTTHLFRVPWTQIGWWPEHYFVKDLRMVRNITKRRIEKKMKRTVSAVANQSVCRSPFHLRSHCHTTEEPIFTTTPPDPEPCFLCVSNVLNSIWIADTHQEDRSGSAQNSMKKQREWVASLGLHARAYQIHYRFNTANHDATGFETRPKSMDDILLPFPGVD